MDGLRGGERVLQSIDRVRRQTRLATGAEASASSLLEDFGFTGEMLTARLDDLSGGELTTFLNDASVGFPFPWVSWNPIRPVVRPGSTSHRLTVAVVP
jgi:hypothetical protein